MLSTIPLDEIVQLDIFYQLDDGVVAVAVQSPLSRRMSLKRAIGHALSAAGTGARVSITARGLKHRDVSEFRAIWARRSFYQQSQ